ncbi:MAG: alpha/beta fold hydrolase [Deltaproteobacteria bacterium]|nr:alpha/beta fold hydrolase [Deltaproteobacteria bacterium]
MPEVFVQGDDVHFQDTVKPMPHTIVFVHGSGGSHHTWRDQWAGLKGAARLVIPDLPGHAESSGSPRESVEAYAEWLADFVKETGLRKFILAGHSMGGAVALQAALSGIGGLEALILAGTGAKLKISPVIFDGIAGRFREFAPELVEWMMAKATGPLLRDDVTKDVLSTRPAAFLSDFRACDSFDVMDRIGRIDVPTLVIQGDDDRLTPLKYGEYLATNIRGAILKIIHDAGHLAMLEKPTEVNDAIGAFVHSLGA